MYNWQLKSFIEAHHELKAPNKRYTSFNDRLFILIIIYSAFQFCLAISTLK